MTDHEFGYLIWGIEDGTRKVVGTGFRPEITKIGNEGLYPWLVRQLDQDLDLRFESLELPEGRIVVMAVLRAVHQPVRLQGLYEFNRRL